MDVGYSMTIAFSNRGWGIAWDGAAKKSWSIGIWWDNDNEIGAMFVSYTWVRAWRVLIWPKVSITRFRDWMGPNKPIGTCGMTKEFL